MTYSAPRPRVLRSQPFRWAANERTDPVTVLRRRARARRRHARTLRLALICSGIALLLPAAGLALRIAIEVVR